MYITDRNYDNNSIKYIKDFDRVVEGNIVIDEDTVMKENLTLLKRKLIVLKEMD